MAVIAAKAFYSCLMVESMKVSGKMANMKARAN
jgi:hypothetical protein